MIAGFFIGLLAWSVCYCYCAGKTNKAEWCDSVDYGAVFAALVILAGNGAGLGYLAQWWLA